MAPLAFKIPVNVYNICLHSSYFLNVSYSSTCFQATRICYNINLTMYFFTLIKASNTTTSFQDREKRDHIRQQSLSLHLFLENECFLAISLYKYPTIMYFFPLSRLWMLPQAFKIERNVTISGNIPSLCICPKKSSAFWQSPFMAYPHFMHIHQCHHPCASAIKPHSAYIIANELAMQTSLSKAWKTICGVFIDHFLCCYLLSSYQQVKHIFLNNPSILMQFDSILCHSLSHIMLAKDND